MKRFPIHEAKAKLSKLIEMALAGETVIIARGKTPVVKLLPLEISVGRKFGAMKGKARVDSAFFEPLPKDELDGWEGK